MQSPAPPVNDKYDFSGFDYLQKSKKSQKIQFFSGLQIYFKILDNLQFPIGVQHRLRNSVEFWRSIQVPVPLKPVTIFHLLY